MPGRVAEGGGRGLGSMGADVGVSREVEGGEGGGAGSSSLISPSSLEAFSELLTDLRKFLFVLTCPSSISKSASSWMVVAEEDEGAERVPFFDEEASPSSRADDFLFLVLRARDRRVDGSVGLEDEDEALGDGLGEEGGGEGAMVAEEEDEVVEDRWL